MSEAHYSVDIELKRVGAGWDDLSSGLGRFSGAVDAVAGKLGRISAMAMVGIGAGAFAAATYGVMHLNAEAEGAAISIGTIFSVNGIATNVPQGITMAGEQIAKMRKDAQALPGTFEQLQAIFLTGSSAMFQAGATADQARLLSAKAMAASYALQVAPDMAAREFAQLLSGRAGAHNVLGTRMGFTGEKAKSLNAESPEKRLATITAELAKFSGAIDAFAHSYVGLSTTFKNNVESFARVATAPLFEDVKGTLADINDWFTNNQSRVNQWAMIIGNDLRGAFDWGKKEILEWGPLVEDFAGGALTRMSNIWDEIQPGVQVFAEAMRNALSDPNGTIDKLVHLAEVYAALKLGGGLVGAAASGAGRVGLGLDIAGASIAGTAIGAGGSLAAAGEGAGAAGGGALAGSAFGPLGIAIGAVTGTFVNLGAAIMNYESVKAAGEDKAMAQAFEFGETIYGVSKDISGFNRRHGEAETSYHDELESQAEFLERSGSAALVAEAGLLRLNEASMEASFALASMAGAAGDKRTQEMGDAADKQLGLALMANNAKFLADSGPNKRAPTMKGGHGGTSIQKVEIVVTSNQNPSRIARQVHAELAKLSTNRRVSPYVRNYSARDEG